MSEPAAPTVDFHEIAERNHELQNPTSAPKVVLLGERLGLSSESLVLDVASGRGGPAVLLAQRFGCRVRCVELREAFVAAAAARVEAAGVADRLELVQADARDVELECGGYDVAMCLGASFVWGGLAPTLAALTPSVRSGGNVVVGEPYWRRWPLPAGHPGSDEPFEPLGETAARFAQAGLALTTLIASSEDDWDSYESLHWRALEDWLDQHVDHPDAAEIRREHLHWRDRYLGWQRDALGWAIFAARKA